MDGSKSVLLLKDFRSILRRRGLSLAALHMKHMRRIRYELKGILVPRHDETVPVFLLASFSHRTEDVIGLPAGTLITGDAHGLKHFLQKRHLHDQILRHGLSLPLILRVLLVTERGSMDIKCHTYRIRLLIGQQFLKNGEKTEHAVCGCSVRSSQKPHAVKGTVYDAVSVQYHQFHNRIILP